MKKEMPWSFKLMSPYELKMKLDLADDRAQFIREHSMSFVENAIVTDDGHMHFFDDDGNDITDSVTSIGEGAFNGCTSLTSVIIPDSVTYIGESAFYGCSSLKSIVIPDSVKIIGEWTFYRCSNLTSINIPSSVKSIGGKAFRGCRSLTSLSKKCISPSVVKMP